jgi:hypothetical protein
MLFIIVVTRAICADHKDIDVVLLSVLLSAICKGYIIIHYLLYFVYMFFVFLH